MRTKKERKAPGVNVTPHEPKSRRKSRRRKAVAVPIRRPRRALNLKQRLTLKIENEMRKAAIARLADFFADKPVNLLLGLEASIITTFKRAELNL